MPTIDGGKAKVKIPAGTQNGKQFRLRGKGMPMMRNKNYGDLYIQAITEVPVSLTKEQKKLLEEFKKLEELCNYAYNSGLEVHLGHGLDYETTKKVTEIKYIQEVNIGFFLVAQSIFDGLENTVKKMKKICERKF